MKKALVFMVLALFGIAYGYSVSTEYIIDFRFENLNEYSFSNVSFIEDRGIELSMEHSVFFESEGFIWSFAQFGDAFLIGAGDYADLIMIDGASSKSIFSQTNYLMFTDIEVASDRVFLSAIPNGAVFELDGNFKLLNSVSVSNMYIWDLVFHNGGVYALAGNPASLYYIKDGKVEHILDLPDEENFTRAKMINGTLYFAGTSTLYRLSGKRAIAVASFDTEIADFIAINREIYLITSRTERRRQADAQQRQQNARQTPNVLDRSAIYAISERGAVREIFGRRGIRFLSISRIRDSLIIGTDKDGGYIDITLDGNRRAFTSLGSGAFVKIFSKPDAVYGLMANPARVVRLGSGYAKSRYFISSVFDTKNRSRWGSPRIEKHLMANTEVNVYTRSGAVKNTEFWEDWTLSNEKINASPNRFIQYKIDFLSSGNNTANFRAIALPYVQKNLPPRINRVSFEYREDHARVSWEADDPNNDTLSFDVYLSTIGGEWVKVTEKPITDDFIRLNYNAFPSGAYRVKVTASDILSNSYDTALETTFVTDRLYIDGMPPVISPISVSRENGFVIIHFSAKDHLLPLRNASYSVNGGEWISINPRDGIFDSNYEEFEVKLKLGFPSFIQIRVSDNLGNTATDGVFVR